MKKMILCALMAVAFMCSTTVSAQSDKTVKQKKECCEKKQKESCEKHKDCCEKQKSCCDKKAEEKKGCGTDCKKCTECKEGRYLSS